MPPVLIGAHAPFAPHHQEASTPVDIERTPTARGSVTDGAACPSASRPSAHVPARYRGMADAMVRVAEEAIADDTSAALGWKEFAKQSGITMWRRAKGNGGTGGTCNVRARTLIKVSRGVCCGVCPLGKNPVRASTPSHASRRSASQTVRRAIYNAWGKSGVALEKRLH